MKTDATLTSKSQVTIPKQIRDALGMKPGDRLTFTLMPDATVVMRLKNKSIADLAGTLRKKGRKPIPVEQLSRVLPASPVQRLPLQRLAQLRQQVPARPGSSAELLRELRDAE